MARNSSAAVRVEPNTVAGRRQSIRAAKGGAKAKAVKVIDLTKPNARKQLVALYPRPTNDLLIDATPETEAAAFDYIAQRDLEKIAGDKKGVAGNVLCNAIGKNKGIVGKGWKAEWDMSRGQINWSQLCTDHNISDATIEKYRKSDTRGLDVTEVADES